MILGQLVWKMLLINVKFESDGKINAKGKRRCCPNNPRGLRLSSDFKTYLLEVSLRGQNQGNQGRKGLEGSQIRIESVSKRREWKLSHFKGNLLKKVGG
jgi:hypothetical protein